MASAIDTLPETITAPRTDAIYNCHAYLTKVPVAAIEPFIQTFSKPGEVVVDFFAGSGMTGLAALKCGRQAELSDISVLGRHIAHGYLTQVTAQELRDSASVVIEQAKKMLGNLYMTKRASDGATADMIRKALKDPRQKEVPSLTIEDNREMYSRSGLGKAGMTETAMFFSPRNALALLELWRAINEIEDEALCQKLRFAFTAILPRASRRYQWSAKRPLNAQNQTYYIAPVYYEWNVFELFGRKIEAAIRAAELLYDDSPLFKQQTSSEVTYSLASADHLSHLDDASVDYVFTDPPFGSNIFYSDMNLFHEAWLGEVTDHISEAVVYTSGKRKNGSAERYEKLLQHAFTEAFRVLKPGRHMSVVFGNSSGSIWGLVQRALRQAGFKASPVHMAILDKGQRSVKGLNSGSEGVVTVDLILTVQKPSEAEAADHAHHLSNGDTHRLIQSAVRELAIEDARNPSHVYARVLKKAIQEHLVLDDLHLGDVLIALRNSGFTVDRKTGLLLLEQEQVAEAAE